MGTIIGKIKCNRSFHIPTNSSWEEEINNHLEWCTVCQNGNPVYLRKKIDKIIDKIKGMK